MQTIRIFFEKRGRAKYISHLDLMRCWSRAVRRADVPLWYTEGFNPHPYLNFPRPLPLGQEGLREPILLRLEHEMPFDKFIENLNAVLPEGMRLLEAGQAWGDPAEITAAAYEIPLGFAGEDEAAAWMYEAEAMLRQGGLKSMRMGKQGHRKVEKEVDVSAMTLAWRLERRGGGGALLRCTLACRAEENLNPALLCEALFAGAGPPPEWGVTRAALLKADGTAWE